VQVQRRSDASTSGFPFLIVAPLPRKVAGF
jgi:hypothetical protein